MSTQLGAILCNLNKFKKIKRRVVSNWSVRFLKVSGIVSWWRLCGRRRDRGALQCHLSMFGCSEQALTNLEISVYICVWVFFLQSQQYWERVTLTEHVLRVFPCLSVFLSPIHGSISNPPLIFCNMT